MAAGTARALTLAGLAAIQALLPAVECTTLASSERVAGAATGGIVDTPRTQPPAPRPDPSLTPARVVEIQLEAFRHNDEPTPDSGIARAFAFASPANQEATGPVERFTGMVKDGQYRALLNHLRAELGQQRVVGEHVAQRVTITTRSGEQVTYVFVLSKQTEAPYAGCWMTDGVIREPERKADGETIARSNGKHRDLGFG